VIGIEEEFFLVDEENLFPISSTPQLILKLVRKDSRYFRMSSMESPLGKETFKSGFPIIELKTAPHAGIDSLLEEVKHNRAMLSDVANEAHLYVVPSGLHPAHCPRSDSRLLCCALHVHVSGYPLKEAFFALVNHIPEFVAVTANSPFLCGEVKGKTMRTFHSYAIGIPKDFYKRASDIIINRKLQTVELRVCDTQIVSQDVSNFVHFVIGVIDRHCKSGKTKYVINPDLNHRRHSAAIGGKSALTNDLEELYEEILPSLNAYGTQKIVHDYLISSSSPADFQIKIAHRHGIASVVKSLWASFMRNELTISNTIRNVRRQYTIRPGNFPFMLFYFPAHVWKVWGKFLQDDMIRTGIFTK